MYTYSRFCGQRHNGNSLNGYSFHREGGGKNPFRLPALGKVGKDVYGGAATIGRVGTLIGAIIATLFSIGLLIGGIYIVARTGVKTYQGTIKTAKCTATPFNTWDCNITIAYNGEAGTQGVHNGKTQDKIIMDSNKKYGVGQKYLVKSGVDIPKFIGWILIGVAIFMLFVSWLWYGLTMRYKPLAAVVGAGDVLGAARGIL